MTQPTVSQHWKTLVSQPGQGPIPPGSAHFWRGGNKSKANSQDVNRKKTTENNKLCKACHPCVSCCIDLHNCESWAHCMVMPPCEYRWSIKLPHGCSQQAAITRQLTLGHKYTGPDCPKFDICYRSNVGFLGPIWPKMDHSFFTKCLPCPDSAPQVHVQFLTIYKFWVMDWSTDCHTVFWTDNI